MEPGFLLAAWIMLEPRLRPALILLPVAGMTGSSPALAAELAIGKRSAAGTAWILSWARRGEAMTFCSISLRSGIRGEVDHVDVVADVVGRSWFRVRQQRSASWWGQCLAKPLFSISLSTRCS